MKSLELVFPIELSVALLEKSKTDVGFAAIKFSIPKYMLYDLTCEGLTFQTKEEDTPHLFYVPTAWLQESGKPIDKVARFKNANTEVLTVLHKAYETYKLAIQAKMDPEIAKQLLPCSNVVTAIAVAPLAKWNEIADRLSKSRRDDYIQMASTIKRLLHG